MKTDKKLALAVTAALLLGTATVQAAPNAEFFYSDVPTDHWAMDAVVQLSADGMLTGYEDGTFKGDRAVTRYEMARMIANAPTHWEKASDEDKQLIDKLSAEFSEDLDNLGIRVYELEQKSDNVKLSGVFANKVMASPYDAHTWWEKELFLNLDGQLKDDWKVHAGLDWKWGTSDGWNKEKSFSDNYGDDNNDVNALIYQLYATGPIGKDINTTFGLFEPSLQSGYVANARVKGLEVDYQLGKTTFKGYTGMVHEKNGDMSSPWSDTFMRAGGKYDFMNDVEKDDGRKDHWNDDALRVYGASVEHQFDDKWSAGLGYYNYKSPHAYGDSALGIVAADAKYNIAENVALTGFYSHGNQNYQNKAYDIKLTYNGSPWDGKRWGAHLGYRYLGSDALVKSSICDGSEKAGAKGIEAGLWYRFNDSIVLTNRCMFGKAIDEDFSEKDPGNHFSYFSNLMFCF